MYKLNLKEHIYGITSFFIFQTFCKDKIFIYMHSKVNNFYRWKNWKFCGIYFCGWPIFLFIHFCEFGRNPQQ